MSSRDRGGGGDRPRSRDRDRHGGHPSQERGRDRGATARIPRLDGKPEKVRVNLPGQKNRGAGDRHAGAASGHRGSAGAVPGWRPPPARPPPPPAPPPPPPPPPVRTGIVSPRQYMFTRVWSEFDDGTVTAAEVDNLLRGRMTAKIQQNNKLADQIRIDMWARLGIEIDDKKSTWMVNRARADAVPIVPHRRTVSAPSYVGQERAEPGRDRGSQPATGRVRADGKFTGRGKYPSSQPAGRERADESARDRSSQAGGNDRPVDSARDKSSPLRANGVHYQGSQPAGRERVAEIGRDRNSEAAKRERDESGKYPSSQPDRREMPAESGRDRVLREWEEGRSSQTGGRKRAVDSVRDKSSPLRASGLHYQSSQPAGRERVDEPGRDQAGGRDRAADSGRDHSSKPAGRERVASSRDRSSPLRASHHSSQPASQPTRRERAEESGRDRSSQPARRESAASPRDKSSKPAGRERAAGRERVDEAGRDRSNQSARRERSQSTLSSATLSQSVYAGRDYATDIGRDRGSQLGGRDRAAEPAKDRSGKPAGRERVGRAGRDRSSQAVGKDRVTGSGRDGGSKPAGRDRAAEPARDKSGPLRASGAHHLSSQPVGRDRDRATDSGRDRSIQPAAAGRDRSIQPAAAGRERIESGKYPSSQASSGFPLRDRAVDSVRDKSSPLRSTGVHYQSSQPEGRERVVKPARDRSSQPAGRDRAADSRKYPSSQSGGREGAAGSRRDTSSPLRATGVHSRSSQPPRDALSSRDREHRGADRPVPSRHVSDTTIDRSIDRSMAQPKHPSFEARPSDSHKRKAAADQTKRMADKRLNGRVWESEFADPRFPDVVVYRRMQVTFPSVGFVDLLNNGVGYKGPPLISVSLCPMARSPKSFTRCSLVRVLLQEYKRRLVRPSKSRGPMIQAKRFGSAGRLRAWIGHGVRLRICCTASAQSKHSGRQRPRQSKRSSHHRLLPPAVAGQLQSKQRGRWRETPRANPGSQTTAMQQLHRKERHQTFSIISSLDGSRHHRPGCHRRRRRRCRHRLSIGHTQE